MKTTKWLVLLGCFAGAAGTAGLAGTGCGQKVVTYSAMQVSPTKITGKLGVKKNSKVTVWVEIRDRATKKIRVVYGKYDFKTSAYTIDSPNLKPPGDMIVQAYVNGKKYTMAFPKSLAQPMKKVSTIPPSPKLGSTKPTTSSEPLRQGLEEPAAIDTGDLTLDEAAGQMSPDAMHNPYAVLDTDLDGMADFSDTDVDGDGTPNDTDTDPLFDDTFEPGGGDEQPAAPDKPADIEKELCQDNPELCDNGMGKKDAVYCDANPCDADCKELIGAEVQAEICGGGDGGNPPDGGM